ncbi:hypothetical protein ACFOUP_18225 [Belliella kenyensis]|uniref:Uncharacterized protein n=1 Tax=Belliella kenyensis TaxID=1472724 RepID=A0ABV8ERH9_9BACT|nr:hypothetical protein [Belliella kenyensis]MCH7402281.1 hypothetical protein [Belliella kenyensis]MDN3601798.1 hypothetical protein [Belliella kenyensis]
MKKSLFIMVAILTTTIFSLSNPVMAGCVCDASTKYKCSGEDSQGNKCKGTGKSDVGIVMFE